MILISGAIRREMIINVAYFTKNEVQPTLAVIIGQAQTITMICVPTLTPYFNSLIECLNRGTLGTEMLSWLVLPAPMPELHFMQMLNKC